MRRNDVLLEEGDQPIQLGIGTRLRLGVIAFLYKSRRSISSLTASRPACPSSSPSSAQMRLYSSSSCFSWRFRELIQVHHVNACALGGFDQLVELQVNSFSVPVLRVLNQEHHQKRDDGRARVDDQLPRIGLAGHGVSRCPDNDDRGGGDE